MPTNDEIKEEDRRIRTLRRMVEFTLMLISDPEMPFEEASRHVVAVRDLASRLFPGKEEVFDLVYAPKFKRLLISKYRLV